MEREQLKQRLSELHQELQSSELDDPDVQSLLHQLSDDIDDLLQRASAAEPAETEKSRGEKKQSLLDRLLSLTEEFEDSHPQLAEAVGRVAAALSRIGI